MSSSYLEHAHMIQVEKSHLYIAAHVTGVTYMILLQIHVTGGGLDVFEQW